MANGTTPIEISLETLLDTLVQYRMETLFLEPGRAPRLRRGGRDFQASRRELSGEAIGRLLAVAAPPGADLGAAEWSFEHAAAGRRFRLGGRAGEGGPHVRVDVLGEVAPAAAPPETASRPPAAASGGCAPPGSGAAAQPPPPRPGAAREIRDLEPLLLALVEEDGSDLHLSSGQLPRLRVDGELEPLRGYFPPTAERLQELLLALAPPRNREEFLARHDTDFGLEIPGRGRFRANFFRDRLGIGAVFRRIATEIPSFDRLGLPPVLADAARLTKGLVLVTGPTGSGKSTTLAAVVDLINRSRADHIITIEDPVEFVHASKRCLVHQREVGSHTESFASALRASLREDPDVVLVGELRDLETTAIAVKTAETGHLVFGTLHTTSAPGTVERLIDQFPEAQQAQIRLMLASSLKAVVSQVLLKRVGGGRAAAFEVLLVTPAVANLIREGKVFQIPSAMQTGRGQGMQSLDESLLRLVEGGVVTAEEAYPKANDKKDFTARLRTAGADLSFLDVERPASPPAPPLRQTG
jgi:twitching motility protein PilT